MASTIPGFATASSYGMWAPARTPDAVLKRLNQEIVRHFRAQETKQKLLAMQYEGIGSSAEEFTAMMKAEMSNVEKLSKAGLLK